jgi:hypothetical protein
MTKPLSTKKRSTIRYDFPTRKVAGLRSRYGKNPPETWNRMTRIAAGPRIAVSAGSSSRRADGGMAASRADRTSGKGRMAAAAAFPPAAA